MYNCAKIEGWQVPSLCRTIYQQEGDDKRASYNDRKLEYWEKKSFVFSGHLNKYLIFYRHISEDVKNLSNTWNTPKWKS